MRVFAMIHEKEVTLFHLSLLSIESKGIDSLPSRGRENPSELAELKEMLRAQQEQLNQLTQGLQQLQSQHAFNQSIARNCVLDFRRSTEQQVSLSQPGSSLHPSRPAENFNPLN
jgi:hypothetical protein